MRTYRILFTGWREMRNVEPIIDAWSDLLTHFRFEAFPPQFVFVHGAARGCDALVDRFARTWPDPPIVERHPANWNAFGKRAGIARNEHMVALGADICLAFPGPGSIGTWHCIKAAANAGIPVRIYPQLESSRTIRLVEPPAS